VSSNTTLARPYARAAFDLARGAQALGEWAQQIEVAAALASDARVGALLVDPRRSQAETVALLLPPDTRPGSPFADFLGALGASGRLAVLPEIAVQFEALKRDAEGTLKVTVRSAVPLDDAQVQKLKSALANRFARNIEIETAVDAALIGGAIIEAGETVIDGSVRGRLARLGQELAH